MTKINNYNIKKNKIVCILIIFLTLLITSDVNRIARDNLNKKNESDLITTPNSDLDLKLSDEPLNEYSGIGKAQNISESGNGNFQNYNLDITNNDNASIQVPNYWKANEIICNISNIYEYDKYWINDTFDSGYDSDFWKGYTNSEYVSFGWHEASTGTNDSIYMKFSESGASWVNVIANWNCTLPVPKEHIPFDNWEIIYKYRVIYTDYTWLPGGGAYNSLTIDVDGRSQEFTQQKLDTLDNDTWYTGNVPLIQPEIYNWALPGNISLIFEIGYKNSFINPTGYLKVFYDNITLKLSTIPKPSQINLTINDLTNGYNASVNDLIEFGKGTVNLKNTWNGDEGGKYHYFSFSHNSTGNLVIYTDFYAEATSSRKTNSLLLIEGSEFMAENNSKTQWTMFFTVTQPGSYSNDYYFNISKPLNWNITEVIDPYLNNKINDTIGAGYGNTTFTIPNNIITNGLWKFVAEAPNYIKEANFYKWSGVDWIKNSTFHHGEKLKINASINTELIPITELTNGSLQIFYPNGTLFYAENTSVSSGGSLEFSEIIIGRKNASAGKYSVCIIWNDDDVNMTQVGFYKLEFIVYHHTSLTAIDSFFEQTAGEPLLIKVRFNDTVLNKAIEFATITYKSTFGSSGTMAYIGAGTYFSEVNTDGLALGDYYFSFNASKLYYENQTAINLIQLRIIAQPLTLEVPSTIISAIANDYAICQINVTGAISEAFITDGVNISTDWENPYSIEDFNNGTFELNFSTYHLPSQGIIETFTVTIFANKTDYGSTTSYISIQVTPLATTAYLNQTVVNVLLNQGFYLKVNYTIAGTGELITGATLNVTWASTYTIFPVADGFIVYFSTSGLSIDIYTIFFQLNHPEYQTAFESIFVIIEENPTYIEVYLNQLDRTTEKTITIQWNEALNITILYKDSLTNDFISGAIVYMNGSGISRVLDENGQQYYTILSSGVMSVGIHFLTVSIEKDNYIFVSEILKIVVEQVVISVGTIDIENSLDVYAGSDQLIKINLTEQNSGNLIPNANISFLWRFDIGEFENLGDGTYQVQLNIPSSALGSYSVELIISVEGGYYKTTESSFLIVVLQEQTPDNSYLIWVIAIVLLSVIGVLGVLIARSYIFLPRKREKEQQFLDKIQVFKDLENIQGIMLIQKLSGMPFFTKSVSEFNFEENILISGFIQAITLFGEQSVIATSLKEKKKHHEIYSEHIIELNFKFFHLLICDYQCLRTLLILKDASSEKLKNQLYILTVEICSKFSEEIEDYKGKAIEFEEIIEILMNKFLFLFYNEPFKLNQGEVFIESMKKSRELESMESRVLNVIITLTNYSEEITLDRIIQEIGEENIDLIYGGLQSLIENKFILPAYFKNNNSNSSPSKSIKG